MMWGHGGTLHGRHAELWRRGGNIGLGSDSANWCNDFDLFRQANLAVLTARDAHEDRTYLLAEDGLRMATRGGARAAGLEAEIGSIEVGKRADLVLHTLDRPEMRPVTDMIRNLVFSSRVQVDPLGHRGRARGPRRRPSSRTSMSRRSWRASTTAPSALGADGLRAVSERIDRRAAASGAANIGPSPAQQRRCP